MSMFKYGIVNLNDNKKVYRKGEGVSGSFTLSVVQLTAVNAIRVHLYGEAIVNWEHIPSVNSFSTCSNPFPRRTESISREKYIHRIFTVLVNKVPVALNNEVLKLGEHKYDFRGNIPDRKLPSSYEGHHGAIRYWLKVEVSVKTDFGLRSYCWYKCFTLLADIDINETNFMTPLRQSKKKDLETDMSIHVGSLTLTSTIDRGGYCPGEKIALSVVAKNDSTIDCKKVMALFLQVAELKTSTETKTCTTTLRQFEEAPLLKGEEIVWENRLIDIDAIPLSTVPGTCRIITVRYYVQVRIDRTLYNWLPVTIGTVPHYRTPFVTEIKCSNGTNVCRVSDGNFVKLKYNPMCAYNPSYLFAPSLLPPKTVPPHVSPSALLYWTDDPDLPPSYDAVAVSEVDRVLDY